MGATKKRLQSLYLLECIGIWYVSTLEEEAGAYDDMARHPLVIDIDEELPSAVATP
jgi:hypothetical protein